jgi:tRNA-splicing ligase RtcB
MDINKSNLTKITDYLWEIPRSFRSDMNVPARIYTNEKMLEDISRDRSLEQLVNVTTLKGIQNYALAMPDAHEGYGFPIGGVAAMSLSEGVISPGGIGYDINCGVRLLKSNLDFNEAKKYFEKLASEIYREIPSGVGRGGKIKLIPAQLNSVLKEGAKWAVKEGYGNEEDLKHIESKGSLMEAKPENVSDHAKKRGKDQLGSLGSGNHFLEVGKVEEIIDGGQAEKLGLRINQVTVLIHSGSRGLGHQVAADYIRIMNKAMPSYGLKVPDRELVCVPFSSPEGQNYFSAMSAAANFAWANRQLLSWGMRKVFGKIFCRDGKLETVYDVAHNIAKIEEFDFSKSEIRNSKSETNSKFTKVVVHRKGATRAFPDQPVIIPGSMGTASYVMLGTQKAMDESFGSICHGAGRAMSRHGAMRVVNAKNLQLDLQRKGILIKTGSLRGLAEEAPVAYKDVNEVVNVVHGAGLARKVAKLKPLVVIKG